MLNIEQILSDQSLPLEFSLLKKESEQEGFRFLIRLEHEWESGKNRFSKVGEALYAAALEGELIGIIGINQDPYSDRTYVGKLRRFYIKQAWRGKGLGRRMLDFVLSKHRPYFSEVQLYTDQEEAATFYEKHGFEKVSFHPKVSHRKFLFTLN